MPLCGREVSATPRRSARFAHLGTHLPPLPLPLLRSHDSVPWGDPSPPPGSALAREPRVGSRAVLRVITSSPLGPIAVYCAHLEVFCGALDRLWDLSDVLRDARHLRASGRCHALVAGDMNTMAHGIARLGREFCRDWLRWRSLGWQEGELWEKVLEWHPEGEEKEGRDGTSARAASRSAPTWAWAVPRGGWTGSVITSGASSSGDVGQGVAAGGSLADGTEVEALPAAFFPPALAPRTSKDGNAVEEGSCGPKLVCTEEQPDPSTGEPSSSSTSAIQHPTRPPSSSSSSVAASASAVPVSSSWFCPGSFPSFPFSTLRSIEGAVFRSLSAALSPEALRSLPLRVFELFFAAAHARLPLPMSGAPSGGAKAATGSSEAGKGRDEPVADGCGPPGPAGKTAVVASPDPPVNPIALALGTPEEVARDLVNPGLTCPFPASSTVTLDNASYRLGPLHLMRGKLDWMLLSDSLEVDHHHESDREEQEPAMRIGNENYDLSDHRWIAVRVRRRKA